MERVFLLTSLILGCNAALYDSIQGLPKIEFDFIIVGGGTAGSVLGNRLTEDSRTQVLVIESGPSNQNVLESIVPGFYPTLANSRYDWNFTTAPQKFLNGRVLPYSRGHVLGGSSSINAMFWTRGTADDYNRWASVTGDQGWSWKRLVPYFLKMEALVSPTDNHNTTGRIDPSIHGTRGNIPISLPGWPQEVESRVGEAIKELGGEFSPVLDMNSGKPLGTSWLQLSVGGGKRSSAATGYLGPSHINRKNLHVVVNTRVTRVLQTGRTTSGGSPVLRTIEIALDRKVNGTRLKLTARKEIILAAGSVGTPNILLHSGIGDQGELGQLGIRPLVHLPSVGKNLTDHPLTMIVWNANSTTTGDILRDPTIQAQAFAEWTANRTGPLTAIGINQVAWTRLPDDAPIWKQFNDPAAGKDTPHFELVLDNSAGFTGLSGFFVGMGLAVPTVLSRGSVTISSSNPFDQPIINPNIFSSAFDSYAMLQAVRTARKFFSASAWDGYRLDLAGPWTDEIIDNDEAALKVLRDTVSHAWHPIGTAAMSHRNAGYGVVDPDLSVKKVEGLRIVDASIMPFIPAAHTQAVVYVIAERAAALIKQRYR